VGGRSSKPARYSRIHVHIPHNARHRPDTRHERAADHKTAHAPTANDAPHSMIHDAIPGRPTDPRSVSRRCPHGRDVSTPATLPTSRRIRGESFSIGLVPDRGRQQAAQRVSRANGSGDAHRFPLMRRIRRHPCAGHSSPSPPPRH
jgi:hypothetical protein